MRILLSTVAVVLLGSLVTTDATAAPRSPSSTALTDVVDTLASLGRISQSDAARLRRASTDKSAPDLQAERLPGGLLCLSKALQPALLWIESQGVHVTRDPPATTKELASSTYPIRIYYNDEDSLAQSALTKAEQSWKAQVTDGKFPVPWTGGDSVPLSQALYIYITDLGQTAGGMAEPVADIPSTPICDCSSRLIINSQLTAGSLGEVVAHEFNHSLQDATDCTESYSSVEPFAIAVQTLQNPSSSMLTKMFLPEFQKYPEYPVDYTAMNQSSTPSYYYQFGAGLFPLFLAERFGNGEISLIAEFWSAFAQNGTVKMGMSPTCSNPNTPNWFEGVDTVLKKKGSSFDDAFDEFSVWRSITGSHDDGAHFKNGTKFSAVETAADHSLASLPLQASLELYEYGSRHIVLKPEGYAGGVTVSVTGDPEATWGASVLLWKPNSPVERVALKFDNEKGTATIESIAGATRIVLVVTQKNFSGHNPDDEVYDVVRTFSYAVEGVVAPPEPGPEPQPEASVPPEASPSQDAELADSSTPVESAAPDSSTPAVTDTSSGDSDDGCGCRTAGRSSQSGSALGILGLTLLLWKRRGRSLSVIRGPRIS